MLFHLSIDAQDPARVAHVLAELFGGFAAPFPPISQGSWVPLGGDDRRTMVEVYPGGTELFEAEGDADAVGKPGTKERTATDFAMATPLSQDQVFAIAAREGWPGKYRKRGDAFGVIELWIEQDRMVEVLTDDMQQEYLSTMSDEFWRNMLHANASP